MLIFPGGAQVSRMRSTPRLSSTSNNSTSFWVSRPRGPEPYSTEVNFFASRADVLIVNQTGETLQDLAIEFATLGDLKLVERPNPHTLGPHAFHNIKATIKVSSTETGVIFGNIMYEKQGGSDNSVNIVLNDIHVDIMDYIKPAYCNEGQVGGSILIRMQRTT